MLQLRKTRKSGEPDISGLAALVEAIESRIADVDDRFPSVRFSDPA